MKSVRRWPIRTPTSTLMEEMGKLQTEIDAADGWDLDSQLEQAMDALQCPDPDTPGQRVLRWRAPPCGPVQAAA